MAREVRQVRRAARPVINTPPPSPAQPPGEPKPKRNFGLWFRRSLMALLGVGLVALISWGFQIKSVSVEPSEYSAELQPQVEAELRDNFLYRHLITLNSGSLADNLQERNLATFKSISVQKNWFGRSITVKAGERQQSLRWQTSGQYYLLDGRGIVIAPISDSEYTNLPLVVDGSNLPLEVNKNAVSSEFVAFTVEADKQVQEKLGLGVKQNRIIDTSSELLVDTDKGFYIRFDTTADLNAQIDTAARVLKSNQPKEYLDVRLPYKAYYK